MIKCLTKRTQIFASIYLSSIDYFPFCNLKASPQILHIWGAELISTWNQGLQFLDRVEISSVTRIFLLLQIYWSKLCLAQSHIHRASSKDAESPVRLMLERQIFLVLLPTEKNLVTRGNLFDANAPFLNCIVIWKRNYLVEVMFLSWQDFILHRR